MKMPKTVAQWIAVFAEFRGDLIRGLRKYGSKEDVEDAVMETYRKLAGIHPTWKARKCPVCRTRDELFGYVLYQCRGTMSHLRQKDLMWAPPTFREKYEKESLTASVRRSEEKRNCRISQYLIECENEASGHFVDEVDKHVLIEVVRKAAKLACQFHNVSRHNYRAFVEMAFNGKSAAETAFHLYGDLPADRLKAIMNALGVAKNRISGYLRETLRGNPVVAEYLSAA